MLNPAPEANAAIALDLAPGRSGDHFGAPLALYIGALAQNLLSK